MVLGNYDKKWRQNNFRKVSNHGPSDRMTDELTNSAMLPELKKAIQLAKY
jgi:hypothetical protein